MKNLMRVISILIALTGIVVIISQFMDPSDILTSRGNTDFWMFTLKVYAVFIANLLPIISIAACAYCLERNDTNYLIRVIPVYMAIPILVSIIIVLFETNAQWIVDFYQFLSKTFPSVTILSIMLIIKPNNKITTIVSYIAYGLLIINV